jgi:hypothetical protein
MTDREKWGRVAHLAQSVSLKRRSLTGGSGTADWERLTDWERELMCDVGEWIARAVRREDAETGHGTTQ